MLIVSVISIGIVSLFSVQKTYAPGLGILVLAGTVTVDDRGGCLSDPGSPRRGPGQSVSICGLVGVESGPLSVNVEEDGMEDNVVIDAVESEELGMIEG